MTTPLALSRGRHSDGTSLLACAGEIDLSNIDTFTRALRSALTDVNDGEHLTVDLSEIEFLDSGAINVLFDHADYVRLIANPILLPVLTVSGLTDLVDVQSSSGA